MVRKTGRLCPVVGGFGGEPAAEIAFPVEPGALAKDEETHET